MRLSILPILLTGASVGETYFGYFNPAVSTQQLFVSPVSLVASEPIRVIENASNANANIRFGHALANANVNGNDDDVARIVRPVVLVKPAFQGNDNGLSHHFCGASLREKAIRLSNAFRHALGMPLIETNVALPTPGEVHILPLGYPPHDVMLHPQDELDEDGHPGKHHGGERPHHHGDSEHEHHPHRHHGHHGPHGHKHRKTFLRRIHRAIKALGPWEGRAVAFVLGKKSEVPLDPGLICCMIRLWYRRPFEDVLGAVCSCLSHCAR